LCPGLASRHGRIYNANAVYERHDLDQPPLDWGAKPSPRGGNRLLSLLGEVLQTVLIALGLFLVVNLVTARIRVEGNSMEPSLHDGEFVVVNRLSLAWEDPSRGDIVVFHFPLDPTRRYIKRVIGVPGDSVSVQEGEVFINGIKLDEPYIAAPPLYTGEWAVGDGEVFVLGDNRNESSDSQNWGNLSQNAIIGKAVLVYWPPTEIGLIPHYELAVAAAE
jgi:signal peptidase I